ncbi:MAG: type IV toxin-antitoxin system AbiEi family antitoxin domain-containing protein [Janthinobacterium lividum]
MHARQPLPPALLRLAQFQDGVVSTAQAESAGMTRHVIARCLGAGQLGTIVRGVYAVGVAPPSFDGLSWAGCLVGGEGSRIGGLAAARLLGLADEVPDVVTVLLPDGRRAGRDDPRWEFVRGRPGVRLGTGQGSPPRISVEDTVLDLCDRSDKAEVVGWVSAAVQRRLTTPNRLRRRVDDRSRLQHRQLVLSLIDDVELGAESPIEIAYLNDVERAHGLLCGDRQRRPVGSTYVTDVKYDPYALLVELDGKLGHLGKGRFRDMKRDNAHVLLGRPTLRFGHADVLTSPCEVAVQVADMLIRCGWGGLPAPCRRCARSWRH